MSAGVGASMSPSITCMPTLKLSEPTSCPRTLNAIIPATTITRMNRKEQREVDSGNFEESIELRVNELEMRMAMFQTVLVKEKKKNTRSIKYLEN